MPCNTDHMEYGYSQGDHKYGPDLYLRSDRDELVKIIGGPMPSSASLLCFLIRKIGPEPRPSTRNFRRVSQPGTWKTA